MITPEAPIEEIGAVHKKIFPQLRRLGIRTLRDLLLYAPLRYEDFSNEKSIVDAAIGEVVTIRGAVKKIGNRRTFRKRMVLTEAVVEDESGIMKAIWFNQPFLTKNIRDGICVALSGKIAHGPEGRYLQNPAYEKLPNSAGNIKRSRGTHTAGLVAVYPETRGITSRWLRYLIHRFLDLRKRIPDPLPTSLLRRNNLLALPEAIRAMHVPVSRKEAEAAERRFDFENLFFIQLRSLQERMRLKKERAPEIPLAIDLIKKFVSSLPFSLTNAQRRSLWEIANDLAKSAPMNRLLEGDVGAGKTVVAAAAALLVVRAGYRAVFMAPTEILARQHTETLKKLLMPFSVSIGLITGSEKEGRDAAVVVGTHALIQKHVAFEKLGLVVVDEQHRFGVEQRAALLGASRRWEHQEGVSIPHFLSMSATPIPRTLALTVYGDLDLSILDEMPKSRKPVLTKVVEPEKRQEAYGFIRAEVLKGRQVFVICPRIESALADADSGVNTRMSEFQKRLWEVKAVQEEYRKLRESVFPDLRVEMLHGKMKPKEKAAVIRRFRAGDADILVSTSVVEVGVDIPNATVMMIEGAERFGLAQIHQFRGRVGRGAEQSYCFLFPTERGVSSRRLLAVAESRNGFELAEKDLALRGPGDLFGTAQSGFSRNPLKGIMNPDLVRAVRREAVLILREDPLLERHPAIRERVSRMEKDIHWE